MGLEARVEATINDRTATGIARLETTTLEFRSTACRVSVPLREVRTLVARDGVLVITAPAGRIGLKLGASAARWAEKIQHPRSRLDKIGVKPGWTVSVIGPIDQDFLDELAADGRDVSIGRSKKRSDAIFLAATKEADLRRLDSLKASIQPAGAIWVIRPKGRPEISERAVLAAGKASGLVDVKVVSFSPTHTAEKFVIPRKDRHAARTAET
jgi:hypothetical protein